MFRLALGARLRKFVGNRRGTTRYKIRLPIRISILNPFGGNQAQSRVSPLPGLDGHTLDIGETGLAVVVPSIRIAGEYLTHQLLTLIVELELPAGRVRMQTSSVRYRMMESKDADTGHLIGVRITGMSEDHRAKYLEFLVSLR